MDWIVKHGKPVRKRILIVFSYLRSCFQTKNCQVMWISRVQTKKLLVPLYGFDIHQQRLAKRELEAVKFMYKVNNHTMFSSVQNF